MDPPTLNAPLPKSAARGWDAKRSHIKAVAQTLFAESGLDTVSTRDIIAAAGYRNTTLINYYFGSKAALIDELIDDVSTTLNAHRTQAMAAMRAGDGPTIRGVLEILATPAPPPHLTDQAARSYTRFIAMLLINHRDDLARLGMFANDAGTALCVRELRRLLPRSRDLGDRINIVMMMLVAALVNEEVAGDDSGRPAPFRIRRKGAVLDAAMAVLLAPGR